MPGDKPLTVPVTGSIVATEVLPLLHDPPVVRSVSKVVPPAHSDSVPAIAAGAVITDTAVVIRQLVGSV